MALTLEGVKKVLEAAHVKATEMGVKVSIAVVDARGDLLGLYRMDGARWGTANFSQGKAFASATYGQPSGALSERANLPIMQSALLQSGGRFVFHQGAMPIKEGDITIGACGVGGATSQEDEDIAIVGIAALG